MLNVDKLVLDDEQIREWSRQRFPVNEHTAIMRVRSNTEFVYLDWIGQQAIPYDNPADTDFEKVDLKYTSFTLYTPEGLVQIIANHAARTNVLVYKLVPWPVIEST